MHEVIFFFFVSVVGSCQTLLRCRGGGSFCGSAFFFVSGLAKPCLLWCVVVGVRCLRVGPLPGPDAGAADPPLSLLYIIVGLVWHRRCKTFYVYCTSIGVGVGWQRRCKTCQLLRELDKQSTVCLFVCLFVAVTMMVIESDHIVRSGEP